jgi:hypothetical protein
MLNGNTASLHKESSNTPLKHSIVSAEAKTNLPKKSMHELLRGEKSLVVLSSLSRVCPHNSQFQKQALECDL